MRTKEKREPSEGKGTWGGKRPNSGRRRVYENKAVSICLSTSLELLRRLEAEAMRLNVSKSHVFSEWLKGLPESVDSKTIAMQKAWEEKRKKL